MNNTLGLLFLAVMQSILLSTGQVFLKIALQRIPAFGMNVEFWKSVFLNWQFALCGLCFAAGSLLWFYILRHFPFSMAFPMVSLSYVFGMLVSIFIFHEDVGMNKWIGIGLIMAGCYFVAK